MAQRKPRKNKPRNTSKPTSKSRARTAPDVHADPGWDRLENALASPAPRGKSRKAQAEVDRLFGEDEQQHLIRLARRAQLVRSRQAPLGNVVFLPGITGSNLDVIDAGGDKDHIWINLWRIIRGRLNELRLASSGNAEADGRLRVLASGVNKTFYARAVMTLRARWNVEPLAYDWRRDIDQASDLLADFIRARFADRPCHLVVHSLGGLVARNFIRRHPQVWEGMKDSDLVAGGRLIMLGTPNYGSFAIPPVLTGSDETIEMLARVDLVHSLNELLEISNTFVGSYMLLPAPVKLKPHLHAIYQKDTWGAAPGVSQLHLNRTFQFHVDLEQSAIDPARMVYVAGCKRVTPTGMSIVAPGEFEYELTSDGDGRVAHELGLLPGVPTYYVDEAHGDLARNEMVLSAVDELLQTGETDVLGTSVLRGAQRVARSMRAYRSAADKRMLEELGRIANRNVTSESQLSDDEKRFAEEAIIKAALGSSTRSMPKPPAEHVASTRPKKAAPSKLAQLQVAVRFGDVAEIAVPVVVVGHYRGVLPTNAIGAIDKKLDGWITRAVRQGMIAGTLGETFYVPTAGRLAAQSVVVAGMGEFGRFGASDLRLVMSNVAQGASALGYSTIATVLVGAGNGNLNRETALREILEGLGNGLGQLSSGDKAPPPLQVIIIERSAARFFELTERLIELSATQSLSSAQITIKKASPQEVKRARASERRDRKPALKSAASGTRTDEVRITVECKQDDEGVYRFSALSQQAVVPVREVKVNQHFASKAARALREASTREEQEKYGRLLHDYLLPHDFADVLDRDQPLRLIVDRATAAFPWEMACFPSRSGAAPLRWLGTDLQLSRQFRTLLSQAPGLSPPVNNQLSVLVIADPAPERDLQLQGARIEGRRVADILKSANGRDFGGGKLKIEVVERIGAGECDPIEILALLLTGDFDIVHYAGHGDYNAKSPEASGWIFGADTVLTAQDIFRARAVPRLVFANACFSGVLHAGEAFAADELSRGLATIAQAFFERGVPNYTGTGWPVDDAQALTIAAMFYQALLERASIGSALNVARRAVFDERIESTWGAYQHYGNPQDHLLRAEETI
ncbi:MAG TPA: CHAT domain-containing protein [Burkholderiaceae bacterium]|nr:CHAT domain-containing protein [Burkholderiaceae bacterium]